MLRKYPRELVKLIYNPTSGRSDAEPTLLQNIIRGLQTLHFTPEVYLTQPGDDLKSIILDALHRKIHLFIVCGGDGTIEAVASHLIGKRANLGIIPAGTQNNVALSLGILNETTKALELLRNGRRSKIDIGIAKSEHSEVYFLEVCSAGLYSALFQSADNLQKGNLSSIGELLTTLTAFPLAKIDMLLENKQQVNLEGHVALIANLPYFGLNYRVTPDGSFDNGLLDVMVFSKFSKLELVGNMLQTTGEEAGNHRIRRYRVKTVEINTVPAMPVQADGTALGNTPVIINVKQKALSVITGMPARA